MLNRQHDALSEYLDQPQSKHVRATLTCLYDVGIVFGVLGVFVGLILLLFTISAFTREYFARSPSAKVSEDRILLAKRDYGLVEAKQDLSSSLALTPIVCLSPCR